MQIEIDDDCTDIIVRNWMKEVFWDVHPLNPAGFRWWHPEDITFNEKLREAALVILEYTLSEEELEEFLQKVAAQGLDEHDKIQDESGVPF
jgi:hypothetical protein